ncbi:19920_t:CDS:2 [Funneliformis geosporum]|uniref:2054_t:CDS:1 n=1 Tax=Funneliformis geosporum TaxID=1117311 RepID=A0A9W4SAI8_9GLOM|nr:2054_t:CDS:2 [Funneliformis geosporum]CAI2173906.1 19920_t:CDS:2 [Funneliformis geosporum]
MPFKGFAQLENICKASSEVAALNFTSHNARLAALLESDRSKKSIRDAAPHERKLFTFVDELGTKSRQELEQPTPLRGPGPITVDKLLRAANVLAQICDLHDVKERIESLAQQYEEITSSIDSLESIKEKVNSNDELKTQKYLEERIKSLAQQHEEIISSIELINLAKDEFKNQICPEEVCYKIDMEKAPNQDQRKLNELEYDNVIIKGINDIMINNCIINHDRRDMNMDTPIPNLSQQTTLGAMVLQIIRDTNELTLSELKIKIGEFSREIGLSEGQGVRAIYTLLANKLITIDRSKGSYQSVRSF